MLFIDLDALQLAPETSGLYLGQVATVVVLVVRRARMTQLMGGDSVRQLELAGGSLKSARKFLMREIENLPRGWKPFHTRIHESGDPWI